MTEYYVYSLSCPETGKPFYIGKGKGDRIHQHEREARSGKGCNEGKISKINQILSKGLEVKKDIIKHFSDEKKAYLYETSLIKSIKGLTNIVQSQEPRAKYVTLCGIVSKIVGREINRCYALTQLNIFERFAITCNNPNDYLQIIKASKKLANKNNWLTTECAYAK